MPISCLAAWAVCTLQPELPRARCLFCRRSSHMLLPSWTPVVPHCRGKQPHGIYSLLPTCSAPSIPCPSCCGGLWGELSRNHTLASLCHFCSLNEIWKEPQLSYSSTCFIEPPAERSSSHLAEGQLASVLPWLCWS